MNLIEEYKEFLDNNKHEDIAVRTIKEIAVKNGFKEFNSDNNYAPGNKILYNIYAW